MDDGKDSMETGAAVAVDSRAGRRRLLADAVLAACEGDALEDVNHLSDKEFMALVQDVRVVRRLAEGARRAFTEPSEDISDLTNEEFIERLLG